MKKPLLIIILLIFSSNYLLAQPSNDDCTNAVTLVPGTTIGGTVLAATTTTGIPAACSGNPNDDVWYKFNAIASYATVTLSSVASGLATSGAMVQAFSGANCGALTSIKCGENLINVTGMTIGVTYYIRVFSSGGGAISPDAGFSISVNPSAAVVLPASGRMMEIFSQTTLSAPNILLDPWEVTYGPDGNLWITEAKGSRVYKMNPTTGVRDTVLNLEQGSTFFSSPQDTFNLAFNIKTISNGPQGGMAGLALHPQFMAPVSPQNYVYISYVRKFIVDLPGDNGIFYRNMLARFFYNTGTGKLESPEAICDSLPGSSDHNSQRIIIAPYGGTDYLFYAAGDMGAGQFTNQFRANNSQIANVYEGKILRYNLAPEGGEPNKYLKWIPNDNPNASSAVWCSGIRNNQGFAYDPVRGTLYGSSHGPYSDDEINIIERAKNYGHPLVIGYKADNNYNTSSAGASNTTSSCPLIASETANATAIGASYKDPLFSAYARPQSEIHNIWLTNPGNGGWPSEGWTGMDFFENSLIPGWKNSLIVSSLKWGRILRLKTDTALSNIVIVPIAGADTVSYFGSINRFRDITFSPSGKDMYVVMDRSTSTSGPSSANPVVPACQGCVQKYSFLGYGVNTGSGNRSFIPTTTTIAAGKTNIFQTANKVVINAANGNNNHWVPITDTNSNIVAEINARGRNLDTVTTSLFTRTGASRTKSGIKYLNRSITITPKNQPGGSVWIRLYISKAEFDAYVAEGGVGSIGALKILKNSDSCLTTISSNTTLVTTSISEAFGSAAYVLQGDISSFSSFYFAPSLITLPVELITFKGTLQNNTTLLQWKTAQEINASHFDVERSIDGSNFSSIGMVTAQGNSSTEINYTYLDNEVTTLQATVVFYRLKMVDTNGEFKYSNVVSVSLPSLTGTITIAPNPVIHEATVKVVATFSGKMQWNLTDNSGRIVLQNIADLKKGPNTLSIDLTKLASGIYFLNVKGAGLEQHIKLQKE